MAEIPGPASVAKPEAAPRHAAALMGVVRTAETFLPAPVRSALDEVVLRPATVSPWPDASSEAAQSAPASSAPEVSASTATLNPPPSLHAYASRWLNGASVTLEPELSGGLGMLRVGGQTGTSASVALRLKGSQGHWGYEIGSLLPHSVSDGFDQATQTQGASDRYQARLASFHEIHAAAIHDLPHGQQKWVVPEIGLGLSFLRATNEIRSVTNQTWSYEWNGQTFTNTYPLARSDRELRWSVSPLVRVGVVFFPQSLFSVRVDAAYVNYANTVKGLGQTFDLGLSGVMIGEMVQVRL